MKWLFHSSLQSEQMEQTEEQYRVMVEEIKQAHEEWVMIQNLFNEATDSDQIDYMIYRLEATEKRYNMLIKKARELRAIKESEDQETQVSLKAQAAKKNYKKLTPPVEEQTVEPISVETKKQEEGLSGEVKRDL